MKSSDDEGATNTRHSARFDVSTLSLGKSGVPAFLDRIKWKVQLGRIAVAALLYWLWVSNTVFDGISFFGLEIFPELNPIFTASPGDVWDYFGTIWHDSLFWKDLAVTLQEAMMGFLFGGVAGFIVGLILGRFRLIREVMSPFLIFTNAVPKVALAPILIVWYGVDIGSKVALATLIVFFIVQIPVQSAVSGVDPDLDTVATTMGATELQKFRWVVVPSILGPLFGALRLAAVYSILSVVFGEFVASKRGLGQRLLAASNQFNIGAAFALMIVLAVLALLFNAIIGLLEKRFLRWQSSEARGHVLSL